MTEKDAEKMVRLVGRTKELWLDMKVKNPAAKIGDMLRWDFANLLAPSNGAVRKLIFKKYSEKSAISGVLMAFTAKEAKATGKPQMHLHHLWACSQAGKEVWNEKIPFEEAGRKLWTVGNLIVITTAEHKDLEDDKRAGKKTQKGNAGCRSFSAAVSTQRGLNSGSVNAS